ncbi:alpha/beta hydrolase [Lapidilactobacillus achengensis]|uniref:Alpha/beta hydrolase n=1 Tax=Lapidilactobacillus achengensis TaxID=2486000 RepID=A0ABW1UMY6_9LACO
MPTGVSAQTAAKTLSGWSGEIRGEIAVKLSLAALPLRTRPDFETSRALCGLAQNSAHSELTPNFAAQAAGIILSTSQNDANTKSGVNDLTSSFKNQIITLKCYWRLTIMRIAILIVLIAVVVFLAIAAWKTYTIAIRTTPKQKQAYIDRSWAQVSAADRQWYQQQAWQTWRIKSEDGLQLVARFLPPATPGRPIVVLAHGYHHTHQQMIPYARLYAQWGCGLLLPDSRGQGLSGGFNLGFGWLDRRDYVAWSREILRQRGSATAIVLAGVSMGGATVLAASGEADLPENVQAIVDDCGFDHVYPQIKLRVSGKYHLPQEPTVWLASLLTRHFAHYRLQEGDIASQVARSHTPTLFIHGDQDDYVPIASERHMYKICQAPKAAYIVPGAGHTAAYAADPDQYAARVKDFLSRYVSDFA